MSKINYKPWVGKNYSTGYQGKKILVLGESHYDPSGEIDEELTQWVIRDIAYEPGGQSYLATFTCFERAIAGKQMTQEERENFWESVIFYNYLQIPTTGPRTTPDSEDWGRSADAFAKLLETYMPDCIIVWGARLYNNLPDLGGLACKIQLDNGDAADYWIYTIKNKEIPALKIHHPSSPTGRCWEYWHKVIYKFLRLQNK